MQMMESIARRISSIGSWDDLRRFEANAAGAGQLTDEITAAGARRAVELGRALIEEKTGLDLSKLSPTGTKIVRAVDEYVGVMRKKGKYPHRTFEQIRNRGLIGAAEGP